MRIFLAVLVLLLAAGTAHAQQRPLLTEDPETIGAGRVLVEGGIEYDNDAVYPVSGLRGDLLRLQQHPPPTLVSDAPNFFALVRGRSKRFLGNAKTSTSDLGHSACQYPRAA